MILKGPPGGSLSYRGQEYWVDDEGLVEVPAEAVDELRSHGFEPAPAPVKASDSKKKGK